MLGKTRGGPLRTSSRSDTVMTRMGHFQAWMRCSDAPLERRLLGEGTCVQRQNGGDKTSHLFRVVNSPLGRPPRLWCWGIPDAPPCRASLP